MKAGGVPHQDTLFTAFRAGVGNALVSLLVDGDAGGWGASGFGIPSLQQVGNTCGEGQRAVQWLLVCAENLVRTQPSPETTARNPGGLPSGLSVQTSVVGAASG